MKKVKVTKIVTPQSLNRTKELQIRKARIIYHSRPFVNQLWMAMQGFPYEFICDNWHEITADKY
jgi:hypothetical protein